MTAPFALPSTAGAVTRTIRTGGSASPHRPPTSVKLEFGETRTITRVALVGTISSLPYGVSGGESSVRIKPHACDLSDRPRP